MENRQVFQLVITLKFGPKESHEKSNTIAMTELGQVSFAKIVIRIDRCYRLTLYGINANRDVGKAEFAVRSSGLKSNRKLPDANKNVDSFHPPLWPARRTSTVSVLF